MIHCSKKSFILPEITNYNIEKPVIYVLDVSLLEIYSGCVNHDYVSQLITMKTKELCEKVMQSKSHGVFTK